MKCRLFYKPRYSGRLSTIRFSFVRSTPGAVAENWQVCNWGDIDFNGKFLTVHRNIVRGRVHRTKTDKIRRVDLSDALIAELSNLRRQRREEWLSRGKNEIPDSVFCNREANPVDMHNVKNRHFNKCLEKAGLQHIRFHDLRHSFASLLIQNG